MKMNWFTIGLCLVLFLTGCTQQLPPSTVSTVEPTMALTTEQTIEQTTEPTTELPIDSTTQMLYCLTDLDLSEMHISGGASEYYYSFCYDPNINYGFLGEGVGEKMICLTPGHVYSMDYETGNFVCVLDEPIISMVTTRSYLFFISSDNTILVTDMVGEMKLILYEAEDTLSPESLSYRRKSLYFIEGNMIMNMDLVTGKIRKLFEYEGAIDADPLYGIEDKFPHLLHIRTATDDVACNLENGETCIIPVTGQFGTEALELFMEYGIWPNAS